MSDMGLLNQLIGLKDMSGSCINFVINDDADLDSIFSNVNSGSGYKLSVIRKSVTLVREHEIQLLYADSYCYSDLYLGIGGVGSAADFHNDLELMTKRDRKVSQEYEKYKREGWSKAKLERWLLQKGQSKETLNEEAYEMDSEKLTKLKRVMFTVLENPSVKMLGIVWSGGVYAKVRERLQIKADDFTIEHLFNLKEEVLLVVNKM